MHATGRKKWLFLVIAIAVILALLLAAWTAIHGTPDFHDHPEEPRSGSHWHFANSDITESSGIAVSRDQPGVFWTINDSGNAPVIYAFDMQGRDLGSSLVEGAENRDWEALTLASCGDSQTGDCLYIAETGDNDEKYPSSTIYRVPEPEPLPDGLVTGLADEMTPLTFTYEDGPHDVEAIFMDSVGRLNLVTKGRSNGVALYRLPADVWTRSERVATRIAAFAIDPESKYERKVNDASISPDGKQLAVRTYDELYVYDWSAPRLARIEASTDLIEPLRICDLSPLEEEQGEAIAWLDSGTEEPVLFALTSEGDGKISLTNCPE